VAGELPRIIADRSNPVPACVTPKALMQFVAQRNKRHYPPRSIAPRFQTLASHYQRIGACVSRPPESCVAVRWDYAFFQMLLETSYLTFRRPDGARGGVPAADNNFAGIGATVPGRPGERFNDVEIGVLAHLQHVLMYSTTRVPSPVAKRTQLVQGDVHGAMRWRNHPVTFGDLATQWVGSGHMAYSRTIQSIADRFAAEHCRSQQLVSRQ
jgi:hypothetical protein